MIHTDIDIDVANREQILSGMKCAYATVRRGNEVVRHPSGVYFTDIPKDPYTNMATLTYDEADELGYFKVDILNNSLYLGIRDEMHLVSLMNTEPRWDMLLYSDFTKNLHHLSNYHKLLYKLKPKSVEQLAMVLAIIRPAKARLQNASWDRIEKEVWVKDPDETYQFKKSHAISYAVSIVVQMNLLIEQLSK